MQQQQQKPYKKQHIKFDQNIVFKDKTQPICYSGCSVYYKDYQSLKDYNWLRSQAIHIVSTLLEEQFHETINNSISKNINNANQQANNIDSSSYQQKSPKFIRYTSQKIIKILDPFITSMLVFIDDQDTYQSLRKQQLFNPQKYQFLFLPVNTQESNDGKGSHWYLLLYHVRQKILMEYDSVGNNHHHNIKDKSKSLLKYKYKTSDILKDRIQKMIKLFYGKTDQILIKRAFHVPKQDNTYDCGVYTLGFMEQILHQISEQALFMHKNKNNKKQTKIDKDYGLQINYSFFSKRNQYLIKLQMFLVSKSILQINNN